MMPATVSAQERHQLGEEGRSLKRETAERSNKCINVIHLTEHWNGDTSCTVCACACVRVCVRVCVCVCVCVWKEGGV
jgi:hypothetical protein